MCVFNFNRSILKPLATVLLLGFITSCSSGGDDKEPTGGISGTGLMLEGTVQNNRALASNTVRIKSIDNPEISAPINAQGAFSISELADEAPYLLRVDFTSGDPYYALTYEANGQQNIHAYTDLAIRNWYASQGLDVNDAFEGNIDNIPTQAQLNAQTSVINSLLGTALEEYGLSDTDIFTADYLADNQGVDGFLDNNPVIIINGDVNIIVTNPESNLQTPLVSELSLETDLGIADVDLPSQPSSLRALSSPNSEIVLSWNTSEDNIGVTGYEVRRDGVLIATSTFPTYIDSTVEEGIEYSYTVAAIDASGNQSVPSSAVIASIMVDDIPPPTPENINFELTANSIRIRWEQRMIADVSSFEVISDSVPLFNTTNTFADQADLLSGVEYCYQIIAVDGSGNRSAPTEESCAVTLQSGVQATPMTPEAEPITDDETLVGVPPEGTILGDWGGLIPIGSVQYPLLIEIEADGSDRYVGSFYYPTRSLCDGSLDFILITDGGEYQFNQDNRFSGGDCSRDARVSLSVSTLGSEQVLEYKYYDPDTNELDYSGYLRSRSVGADDLLDDSWGGIMTGPMGETPLIFNIEAGTGGTMDGGFYYPILSLCRGSMNFVAKINEDYEFYQNNMFSGGDCNRNARVTVSKSVTGSQNDLEFRSYDPETNLEAYRGTLQLQFVSPDDPIVGEWGGLVTLANGTDVLLEFNIEADSTGKLSGDFIFPTRSLCDGPVNYVSNIDGIYELYQDSRFSGGDCSQNARVQVSVPANQSGLALDYKLFDLDTNQIGTMGRLMRQ